MIFHPSSVRRNANVTRPFPMAWSNISVLKKLPIPDIINIELTKKDYNKRRLIEIYFQIVA